MVLAKWALCARFVLIFFVDRLLEGAVEPQRRVTLHPRQNVRIEVQRYADAGMPNARAHDFWMYALLEKLRRVGVAQIVKAHLGNVLASNELELGPSMRRSRTLSTIQYKSQLEIVNYSCYLFAFYHVIEKGQSLFQGAALHGLHTLAQEEFHCFAFRVRP